MRTTHSASLLTRLALLVIVTLLSACPAAGSGDGGAVDAVIASDGSSMDVDFSIAEGPDAHATGTDGKEWDLDGEDSEDGDVGAAERVGAEVADADVVEAEAGDVGVDPCQSSDPCVVSTLQPDGTCADAPAEDGTACTAPCFWGAACQGGECAGNPDLAKTCLAPDDPTLCVVELICDPATDACTHEIYKLNGTICDTDDDWCTPEACDSGGACKVAGAKKSCLSQTAADPCWTYECDPGDGQCKEEVFALGFACDDEDLCTHDDACTVHPVFKEGCYGTPIAVDDGNPCTADQCVEGVVQSQALDGVPCDDEDECTLGDVCVSGTCTFTGWSPACVETCDVDPECDDGDPCTADHCAGGICEHVQDDCFDGDACTTGVCTPLAGCVFEPVDCEDFDVCTTEACYPLDGCVYVDLGCDDWDPCTIDECSSLLGCVHTDIDNCFVEEPVDPGVYDIGFTIAGFDMADDGSVTVVQITGGSPTILRAGCASAGGTLNEAAADLQTLPSDWQIGSNGVYVTRSDASLTSVVAAHIEEVPDGADSTPPSMWRLYFLDDACKKVKTVNLPKMVADVDVAYTGFFDIVTSDQGLTAAVHYGRESDDEAIRRRLAIFDATGNLVVPIIDYAPGDGCALGGIRVAMREPTGDIIVTCQGDASAPVRYRRYTASGLPVEASLVTVAPSAGGNSSGIDSHLVGRNDLGGFVIVYQQSASPASLRGAFYNASADLVNTVSFGPLSGATEDGYRNVHGRPQAIYDGSYVIPGPYTGSTLPWFGRYSATGVSILDKPLTDTSLIVRIDGVPNSYVVDPADGSKILVNKEPYNL